MKSRCLLLHLLLFYCAENDLTSTLKLLVRESTHIIHLSPSLILFLCFRAKAQFWFPQQRQCRSQNKNFDLPQWLLQCSFPRFVPQSWRNPWFNSDIYVCYNKFPIHTNIVPIIPPSVLTWRLEEHLRSHPHSTPSHCLHLGSPPWSDRSPLAETLPLNPNLSVKARRRSITLPFFCSLLKQRHKRLFYNTLSTVCMDKRMFYNTISMVCMDKRMQEFNRLSSKKYALIYLLRKVFALVRAPFGRRHLYTEIVSPRTLFLVKGALSLPSCIHEVAYCWQRSCQLQKAVGQKNVPVCVRSWWKHHTKPSDYIGCAASPKWLFTLRCSALKLCKMGPWCFFYFS